MNSSSLRRLAKDQASLRRSTPPNYLFPENGEGASLPDDLTQLTIMLTGAQGTPYSQGLWRLSLKMPEDYPKSPPKATFKTRIYHPNVEESTGAVCLDTLKRDWQPKLTLRDILITISCLLIHPNPDSALNAGAGALLQEDYDAFARQAKLMTSIHAPIPKTLKHAVMEAKRRGEDGDGPRFEAEERPAAVRASSSSTSVVMKKKPMHRTEHIPTPPLQTQLISEEDEQHDEAKENDPSQSPSPVLRPPPSPRKNVLGKRPLSELPTPSDPEGDAGDDEGLTASERNVNANRADHAIDRGSSERNKKSPKLSRSGQEAGASSRVRSDESLDIYEDAELADSGGEAQSDEKENFSAAPVEKAIEVVKTTEASQKAAAPARPTLRKVSNVGSARGKGQARVGIRRL